MAFDKLCGEYRSAEPTNPSDARDIIERIILEIHDQHIFRYYGPTDQSRPILNLIVALRCSNGEPVMVKTTDTATVLGGFFESVGAGKPLFEYWAQVLYHPNLSMDIGSYLCSFILSQVKANVSGCGGFTFVAALPNDASRTGSFQITSDGAIFAGFPHSIVPVLTRCLDFTVSDADFEELLQSFSNGIRMTRQNDRMQKNARKVMTHGVLPDAPLGSEHASVLIDESIKKTETKD